MNNAEIEKFLETLKKATMHSGLKQCPFEIEELGKELGLSKEASYKIASHLVNLKIVEYKSIGDSMIQLL